MYILFGMKYIIASGPIIIENGKLMVIKDGKDDFYKIPGGTLKLLEGFERCAIREVKEETNAEVELIKPLNSMVVWKNPQTNEEMCIVLIHYLAKLKNKNELKPIYPIQEIQWLRIEEIKAGKHKVAPNIMFLIEKGDIN